MIKSLFTYVSIVVEIFHTSPSLCALAVYNFISFDFSRFFFFLKFPRLVRQNSAVARN